ncbi:MAG: protein kinase [Aeromicrobium sp.]|nr:protein kinase [Burkholderiales bacterium]
MSDNSALVKNLIGTVQSDSDQTIIATSAAVDTRNIAYTCTPDASQPAVFLGEGNSAEYRDHRHLPMVECASSDATVLAVTEDDITIVVATQLATVPATDPAAAFRHNRRSAGQSEIVPALPDGFRLFEYRIDTVLGQGGFGITYLATDMQLNVKVAIKEYLPTGTAARIADRSVGPRWPEDAAQYQAGLDSFLVEARTLATFHHPNIVRVARFFEAHRTAYIVLEYERGEPLKTWWPLHAAMSEHDLLALMLPLLDGLEAVHRQGYLHRDIKPANIYVRQHDDSLVLLDFGAARQTASFHQDAASAMTPGYAPPEQSDGGQQGPWTDIYAIGATLYWMTTGQKSLPATQRFARSELMPAAKEIGAGRYSVEFLEAIDWALELDARARPQDVGAFRRALFGANLAALDLRQALGTQEPEPVPAANWRAACRSPKLLHAKLKEGARAVLRPASWPLAAKMTIAMLFAALLPMTLTAYYNLRGALAVVSAGESREMEQYAFNSASRVAQLVNDSRSVADYLGTDQEFAEFFERPAELVTKSIQAKFQKLAKTNPNIHTLILLDTTGTARASNDATLEGLNFAFREYFTPALAGRSHITGLVVPAKDGEAGIFYANPVRSASGTVVGVLVLRIKGSAIAAILDEIKQESIATFMLDGDGVLIHYHDRTKLYQSLMPLTPDRLQKIVADQRFRRDTITSLDMPDLAAVTIGAKAPGTVLYASTLSGQTEIAGYAPVPGHDWVVGVTESRLAFEAPLHNLFANVLASLVFVGVIFIAIAVLFARTIVQPINRLTNAAHALKQSDYDGAHIKVTANDELGRLARTFNIMTDVLRQREREDQRRRSRIRDATDDRQDPQSD